MKKINFTILSFFVTGLLCAQISLAPKAAPSPNTASLGIYGSIPVGYYTGVPQINIPLYEIELNGLKLPISLNYHASGIKVAQDASWVGMGWSLNAGGCITRSIRGWADYGPGLFRYDPPAYVTSNTVDPAMKDYNKYSLVATNKADAEPDIFYFNFGNYSGSFFIQKEHENADGKDVIVVQSPNGYLDIKYNSDQWIITDGDGFKYFFRIQETTRNRALSIVNSEVGIGNQYAGTSKNKVLSVPLRDIQPEIISAWYLDAILGPNGQEVTFQYKEETIYTPLSMQESIFEPISGIGLRREAHTTYSFAEVTTPILKQISGPNLIIDFIGKERFDIEPYKAYPKPSLLAEINIKNSQSLLKKYKFDYFYTGALNDYDNCRLFLNSIQEEGYDGANGGKYLLGYYEGLLPSKVSTDVDYWGYYTKPSPVMASRHWGKTINNNNDYSTLVPPYKNGNLLFYGQNRNSDLERMRVGTLNWIKYPTGGQTLFKFEPHIIENGGTYNLPPQSSTDITISSLSFNDVYNGYSPSECIDDFANGEQNGSTFEIENTVTGTLTLKIDYWADDTSILSDFWSQNKYVAILKKYNQKTLKYDVVRGIDLPPITEDSETKEIYLELDKGIYRIDVNRSFTFLNLKDILKDRPLVSWNITGYVDLNISKVILADPIGAGLRIQEIESITEKGTNTKKAYTYFDGTLMSPIISHYYTDICSMEPDGGGDTHIVCGLYLYAISDSYVPMSSSASGNFVGYSKVREFLSESSLHKGYSEYDFYNEYDEVIDSELFLPNFPTIPNLSNGLIKRKADYNDIAIVHEELYTYEFVKGPSSLGLRTYLPAILKNDNINPSFYIKFYDIHSSWNKLKSKVVTEYGPDGQFIWRNTEDYIYEPTNYKIKEILVGDSRTNVFRSRVMEYPINKKSSGEVYNQMIDQHLVNPVIEERNYLINENSPLLTNAWRIPYQSFAGKLLPESLLKNTGKSYLEFEIREQILNYDSFANPTYLIKDSATNTVYLWSYGGQYLIAEIKNATYEDVNKIININNLSNKLIPEDNDYKTIRSLENTLKSILITTYTYKPLVGMTSMTDPRGVTTTYEYDAFGRLSKVKDNNGKIVQSYDYHYQNQ